ncbi:MAG: class I SAM-dependent methyltransferase [Flavobacteriales bacterium]|jgi:trans-aconitate methyltransferase|nr:class I SAM-dependent methyltransferase [Flavobacteriales bacterium]
MEQLFDKAEEYDDMLNQGLKLSGESKEYFLEGRISLMKKHLPGNFNPKSILDFGCGIGDTTEVLATEFPDAEIVGIDTAEDALAYATKNRSSDRLQYQTVNEFDKTDHFDLAYVNGVFHHIPLHLRETSAKTVCQSLKKGGYFAYFENNPWNPGTKMVMNRIPFDRDAVTLSYLESKRLLKSVGFGDVSTARFAFYFPNSLSFLRIFEPRLERLPLGAQYLILAKKG